MAEMAAFLEQERVRTPKERFYTRRPPYPLRILSKPYLERYEPQVFAWYDGRKGSVVEHVSKFIYTPGPYTVDTYVFRNFLNHCMTMRTPGTSV